MDMAKAASGWRLFLVAGMLATSGSSQSQQVPPADAPATAAQQPANPIPQARPQPQQPQPPQPPRRPRPRPAQQSLPPIPPPPTSLPEYPDCRNDHVPIVGRVDRANQVGACMVLLGQYVRESLPLFARRMGAYRNSLRLLWARVKREPYSVQQKAEFYARLSIEFANATRDGTYMDGYRRIEGRYLADRTYLRTEYCNLVRCRRTRRR